jgi:hypothetical protein
MTGRIIRLGGDHHHETRLNLPWYVNGQLDPIEHARAEAHIKVCAECQAELKLERWLEAEVAELPIGIEPGWQAMQDRLRASAPRGRRATVWIDGLAARLRQDGANLLGGGRWQGWAIAAQFMLLLAAAVAITGPRLHPDPARYVALGGSRVSEAANLVVMFGPETPERAMQEILNAGGARIVDGPNVAGAYVLHVAPAGRDAALAALRRRPEIVLAQPIDAQVTP